MSHAINNFQNSIDTQNFQLNTDSYQNTNQYNAELNGHTVSVEASKGATILDNQEVNQLNIKNAKHRNITLADKTSETQSQDNISNTNYTSNYVDGCMHLLSERCQQAISAENCKKTNEELSIRILDMLFTNQSELSKLFTDKKTSWVGRAIAKKLDSSKPLEAIACIPIKSNMKNIFYYELENNRFPMPQALQAGFACIQDQDTSNVDTNKDVGTDADFSTKLFRYYGLTTKTKDSVDIDPIATVAIYLYKNANNTKAQCIIAFLNLAIATQLTHADTNIKINLLLEVASLIENNTDCLENIKKLFKYIGFPSAIIDSPTVKDNQNLIDLFRKFQLTTA